MSEYALIAANCIGALTEEKDSLANIFKEFFRTFNFSGIAKKPNLHPPAPHHLLKPVLTIVLSGQKLEIDFSPF